MKSVHRTGATIGGVLAVIWTVIWVGQLFYPGTTASTAEMTADISISTILLTPISLALGSAWGTYLVRSHVWEQMRIRPGHGMIYIISHVLVHISIPTLASIGVMYALSALIAPRSGMNACELPSALLTWLALLAMIGAGTAFGVFVPHYVCAALIGVSAYAVPAAWPPATDAWNFMSAGDFGRISTLSVRAFVLWAATFVLTVLTSFLLVGIVSWLPTMGTARLVAKTAICLVLSAACGVSGWQAMRASDLTTSTDPALWRCEKLSAADAIICLPHDLDAYWDTYHSGLENVTAVLAASMSARHETWEPLLITTDEHMAERHPHRHTVTLQTTPDSAAEEWSSSMAGEMTSTIGRFTPDKHVDQQWCDVNLLTFQDTVMTVWNGQTVPTDEFDSLARKTMRCHE